MYKAMDSINTAKRGIIDLRPFFNEGIKEDAIIEINDEVEKSISTNQLSISKEKETKRISKPETPIKLVFLKLILSVQKSITYGLIVLYQKFYDYIKGIEFGGSKNFERKFSKERKFYLGISLPDNVRSVEDIFFYYPLLSKKMAYEILAIRKDNLKNFNSVFKK